MDELSVRQRELADAALRLIARGGLAAATFRAVAAEAGCSVGAVQKAFPSKLAMTSAAFARLRERSAPMPPGEPGRPDLVSWLVELFAGVMPLDPPRRAAQLQGDAFTQWALDDPSAAAAIAGSDAQIRGLIASLIDRARGEGEVPAHVDAAQAAWGILAVAAGAVQQQLYDPAPEQDVRGRLAAAFAALLG